MSETLIFFSRLENQKGRSTMEQSVMALEAVLFEELQWFYPFFLRISHSFHAFSKTVAFLIFYNNNTAKGLFR